MLNKITYIFAITLFMCQTEIVESNAKCQQELCLDCLLKCKSKHEAEVQKCNATEDTEQKNNSNSPTEKKKSNTPLLDILNSCKVKAAIDQVYCIDSCNLKECVGCK